MLNYVEAMGTENMQSFKCEWRREDWQTQWLEQENIDVCVRGMLQWKVINLYTNSKFLFFAKRGKGGNYGRDLPPPTLGMVCTPEKGEEAETEARVSGAQSQAWLQRFCQKKKEKKRVGDMPEFNPQTLKLGVVTEESQI